MSNSLNCGKFGKNQPVKSKPYKLDYSVVLVTVLFSLIFPVGVALSLTKQNPSEASGKLIVQTQTREERLKEGTELFKQGLDLYRQGKYQEALELFEKALVISREIGEKSGEGTVLNLCRLQRLQRLQIKHLTLLSFSTTYRVDT